MVLWKSHLLFNYLYMTNPKNVETSPAVVSGRIESPTELNEGQKLLAETLARLNTMNGTVFSKNTGLGNHLTYTTPDWKNNLVDINELAKDNWISDPTLVYGTNTKVVYPTADGKWVIYLSKYRSAQEVWVGIIGDSHKKTMQASSTESFMVSLDPKNPKNVQVTKVSSPIYKVTWDKTIMAYTSEDWSKLKWSITVWNTMTVSVEDLRGLVARIDSTIKEQEDRNIAKEKADLARLKWEVAGQDRK